MCSGAGNGLSSDIYIRSVEQGLYQNGFEKSAVKVGVTLFGVCEYAPVTS